MCRQYRLIIGKDDFDLVLSTLLVGVGTVINEEIVGGASVQVCVMPCPEVVRRIVGRGPKQFGLTLIR